MLEAGSGDMLLMVATTEDEEEVYVSIELDTGFEDYPKNNPTDIRKCVHLCNNLEIEDLKFIDMYGIIKHGYVELWEEIEDEDN